MPHIKNNELQLEKIPTPDAPMSDIKSFGQDSFNAYQVHGSFSKCADIFETTISKDLDQHTLTDLRTALFFLIRKDRNDVWDDTEPDLYRNLMIQIREKVAEGEIN